MRNFIILFSLLISSQSLAVSPVQTGSFADQFDYTNAVLVDKAINDIRVRTIQNLANQEKWQGLKERPTKKAEAPQLLPAQK